MTADGVQLRDEGGVALRYFPFGDEQLTAERATVTAGLDRAVATVLSQLAGWWLSSEDDALTDALLANGATIVRHVILMSRELRSDDMTSEDGHASVAIRAVTASPAELTALAELAYPADHVDHHMNEGLEQEFVELLSGAMVGPYMSAASGQVVIDDEVVAVCIINRGPEAPPYGGPWVSEVFRHPSPRYAGLGRALMNHAVQELAAAGEQTLSLVVSHGNPAQRLYEAMGFDIKADRRKLLIPV